MDKAEKIDRVWDILEKHGVGMLTTRFADGLRARPLEARPDREAGLIYFVTDVRGLKDDEIEADPAIGFVVVDREGECLSLDQRPRRGNARSHPGREDLEEDRRCLVAGRTRRSECPRDPARTARAPSCGTALKWKAVAMFEFAKARLTGEKPNLGEKRKVTVDLKT